MFALHIGSEQAARDSQWNAFLASQGLRAFRLDDLQALKEIEGVMKVMVQELRGQWEGNPPGRTIKTCVTYDWCPLLGRSP